jgi:hypothetical protein
LHQRYPSRYSCASAGFRALLQVFMNSLILLLLSHDPPQAQRLLRRFLLKEIKKAYRALAMNVSKTYDKAASQFQP